MGPEKPAVLDRQVIGGEVFEEFRAGQDPRYSEFRAAIGAFWPRCWNNPELRAFAEALHADPSFTLDDLKIALSNYRQSEWKKGLMHFLVNFLPYRMGPINEYGRSYDAISFPGRVWPLDQLFELERPTGA